jgi:hypothetical protein
VDALAAQAVNDDAGWVGFRRYRKEIELSPRPLRLLSRPEPIEAVAEVPDGPPLRFRWRRALHEVIAAEGPERIEGVWWNEHGGPARDYFRVEDKSGLRFWLFRAGLYRLAVASSGANLVPARTFARFRKCNALSRTRRRLQFPLSRRLARGAPVHAAHIGIAGLGLCDRNLSPALCAHIWPSANKIYRCVITRVHGSCLPTQPDILVHPRTAPAGKAICLLRSKSSRRKSECILRLDDPLSHALGLIDCHGRPCTIAAPRASCTASRPSRAFHALQ